MNETRVFKQGRSGSQLWWSLRYGKQRRLAPQLHKFTVLRVSRLQQRDKNSELRRWSWHFREAGAARICRTDTWESCRERVTEIYRGCLWSLELRTEQCSGTDWNVDGYMKNSFWKLQLNHQKMKTITSEMKNTLDEKSSWHITGGKGELTYHWTLSKMKNRIKITEKDNKQSVCELWDHVK